MSKSKIIITKDVLVDLYINKQMPASQIAKQVGCSEATVNRYRAIYGIQTLNRETALQKKLTKEILEDLYINKQMSYEKIAKEFECDVALIQYYIKKYKISVRKNDVKSIITKEKLFDCCVNRQMTDIEIAKEFNCGRTTIRRYMQQYNIKSVKKETSNQQKITKEILEELYVNKQMSYDKIAHVLNCGATTIQRYIKKYNISPIERKTNLQKILDKDFLFDCTVNKQMTDGEIAKQCKCSTSSVQQYRKRYAIEATYKSVSAQQKEIYNVLLDMFSLAGKEIPDVIMCDKDVLGSQEIDIYIPSYKFGIEFNGGFWHSEENKNKYYHYNKSMVAERNGVFIYHIFSYEWEDKTKRSKILNQIQNLLELNQIKIDAYECEIREVGIKEKNDFLNANHIQGNDNATIKLGLYYENELVSLMTFAKPRFTKKYKWELSRFCLKAGYNVIDAAPKLFKYFTTTYLNNNESIVSYSDIAKTNGDLYSALGFKLTEISSPNYVWWKNDADFKTRYQCQMENEAQIMQNKKYLRVYDCGNKVWVYPNKIAQDISYDNTVNTATLYSNNKPTKEVLIDMYVNKQMSDTQIAKELECSKSVIYRCRTKYNIQTLSRESELHKKLTKEYLTNMYVNQQMTDEQIAKKIGCATCTVGKYRAKYGIETKNNTISTSQQEVYNTIYEMFSKTTEEIPEIIISDKRAIAPFEIDIFIPEYNFGVEFNGGFWHSEAIHDKMYHYNKSKLAQDKGIFIYHIFSYEWENNDKREKILNQIKNLLGLNKNKIYARKCEIREVSVNEKAAFLNANHVQGNDHASIKLGLYYNNELISLMTFVRPRFNKKYDWELSRFCSKANCNVIGGASKIFKYFVTNYLNDGDTVISYSDIAKTKGNLYANLGFTFVYDSNPNYVWWKNDADFKTRYQAQMKNEVQIMQNKKYLRIYDCGNKAWVYKK